MNDDKEFEEIQKILAQRRQSQQSSQPRGENRQSAAGGKYLRSDRNSRIKAKRRKERRRQYLVFGGAVLALIAVILLIVFCVKGCSKGNPTEYSSPESLIGQWRLNSSTTYSFDGDGNGEMMLPTSVYAFTYKAEAGVLTIDFVSSTLSDCTYTFTVKDDTLTLIGGEGTVGGTYELTKLAEGN